MQQVKLSASDFHIRACEVTMSSVLLGLLISSCGAENLLKPAKENSGTSAPASTGGSITPTAFLTAADLTAPSPLQMLNWLSLDQQLDQTTSFVAYPPKDDRPPPEMPQMTEKQAELMRCLGNLSESQTGFTNTGDTIAFGGNFDMNKGSCFGDTSFKDSSFPKSRTSRVVTFHMLPRTLMDQLRIPDKYQA